MGWKIVRDSQPLFCEKNGVYVRCADIGELYDLLDVVRRLIDVRDPRGASGVLHQRKVAELGGFEKLIEWCPVPDSYQRAAGGYDPTA